MSATLETRQDGHVHPHAATARVLAVDPDTGAVLALTTLAAHRAHFGDLPHVGGPTHGKAGNLAEEADRAGLRGRGGGWFPSARKMQGVVTSASTRRTPKGRQPVVIANGMEGEPASGKDAVLLTHSPHLVLDGIELAARTVGAREAFIAVHRGSPTLPTLERAIRERNPKGRHSVSILIATPPARYVASEESALSHWVGDGAATPVYGARPFEKGVRGRPTLVQNVETLAHLALIARYGADWFRSLGAPTAPGTTLVTVGGAVTSPGVVEVATGTPVRAILDRCGGADEPLRAFVTGGYGGAWASAAALIDTPWEPDAVREAGGVVGAGILWALPTSVCGLGETARVARWMAGESAGNCGPCRFGLPSVAGDLELIADRAASPDDVERLIRRLGLVSGRGGCKHPDGVVRFASTALEVFGDELDRHAAGTCSSHRRPTVSLPLPHGRPSPVAPPGRDFA